MATGLLNEGIRLSITGTFERRRRIRATRYRIQPVFQLAPALSDRIRKLSGISFENDYSFLQPGGNDQLIQFFHKSTPDEYDELDSFSRHSLFLSELEEKTGTAFQLDDDNRFAVCSEKGKKGTKAIQALMDLRDEDINLLYYWGTRADCLRLNQRLRSFSGIDPCYFSSPILLKTAEDLVSITAFRYRLEQLPTVFRNPITMKGEIKGEIARKICAEFAKVHKNWFNVESVSGHSTEGSQGTFLFRSDGLMQIDICRLSGLLEVVSGIFAILKEKYAYLRERNIPQENGIAAGRSFRFECSPLEIELPTAIENVESFAKQFTNGRNALQLVGNFEKISPKLWNVKSTDINFGYQIELELSRRMVRIKPKERQSLLLTERIERFLRRHICAHLASSAF